MENLKIQKINNQDMLVEALNIRDMVFTQEKGVPKSIEVDEYDKLSNICDHFLIEYNLKNVGTVRCLKLETGAVKLQRFCFLKEYRKLGLGRNTLNNIETYYKNNGIKEIIMDAKYQVAGFYEKCGYEKISDIFIEADIEHIKMKKFL